MAVDGEGVEAEIGKLLTVDVILVANAGGEDDPLAVDAARFQA